MELEDTDSESTMKDIEDNLDGVDEANIASSSASQRQHRRPRKQSSRPRGESKITTTGGRDSGIIHPQSPAARLTGGVSALPRNMHFRFQAELQQYDSVNASELHLALLEQIKQSNFDSQRSWAEVQAEMQRQFRREQEERSQWQLRALDTTKLTQVLDNQVGTKTRAALIAR
jgi:hypothetical protein